MPRPAARRARRVGAAAFRGGESRKMGRGMTWRLLRLPWCMLLCSVPLGGARRPAPEDSKSERGLLQGRASSLCSRRLACRPAGCPHQTAACPSLRATLALGPRYAWGLMLARQGLSLTKQCLPAACLPRFASFGLATDMVSQVCLQNSGNQSRGGIVKRGVRLHEGSSVQGKGLRCLNKLWPRMSRT